MRNHLQALGFATASALLAPACLLTAATAEFSVALGPIQIPDRLNANLTVANLTQLAAHESGAVKAQALRLAVIIKNLFAAEYQLVEAFTAGKRAAAEVRLNEQNSKDWMKPNLFGHVNEAASREALAKATAIKLKAMRRITDARQNLIEQLQEMDVVMAEFYKLEEYAVVLVLVETSAEVATRALPKDSFTSGFPPDFVANAREVLHRRRLDKARGK